MGRKYKIADWLVHGGHQYEFFKTGHDFYCSSPNGSAPNPNSLGRPINKNVKYLKQNSLREVRADIIMVRSPVKKEFYKRLREKFAFNKPPGIAVMQTTTPFDPPKWVKCIVWNSEWCMKRYSKRFEWAKNFYIPHGFDPGEFSYLDIPRNGKVLAAGSLFRERGKLLGYSDWRWVADRLPGRCSLIGHGNDDIESIGSHPLDDLVKIYNQHSAFLNTTIHSAMPRTRAEAMMCGTPVITTSNYGIENYLVDDENCIIANTKEDMLKAASLLLQNDDLQKRLSVEARKTAIKYFSLDSYLSRWEEVFEEALK